MMKLVVDNNAGLDYSRDSIIVCAFCKENKFDKPDRVFVQGTHKIICSTCATEARELLKGDTNGET